MPMSFPDWTAAKCCTWNYTLKTSGSAEFIGLAGWTVRVTLHQSIRDYTGFLFTSGLQFRVLELIVKALYGLDSSYQRDCFCPHSLSLQSRSDNKLMLTLLPSTSGHVTGQTFSVQCPQLWRLLPSLAQCRLRCSSLHVELKAIYMFKLLPENLESFESGLFNSVILHHLLFIYMWPIIHFVRAQF